MTRRRNRTAFATPALPRDLEPKRDLWPGIRNAIVEGPVRRAPVPSSRLPRLLIAAAAVIVVTIGGASHFLFRQSRPYEPFASLHKSEAGVLFGELDAAWTSYREARDRLMETLEAIDGTRRSGPVATIRERFDVVDREISYAVAELSSNPENLTAAGELLVLFDRQIRTISFTESLIFQTRKQE